MAFGQKSTQLRMNTSGIKTYQSITLKFKEKNSTDFWTLQKMTQNQHLSNQKKLRLRDWHLGCAPLDWYDMHKSCSNPNCLGLLQHPSRHWKSLQHLVAHHHLHRPHVAAPWPVAWRPFGRRFPPGEAGNGKGN